MLIIFEGPDGSGKSMLADHVYRKTSATYVHQGPPPAGAAFDTFMSTIEFAARTPATVVADRLHWGALPYGEVYRGGCELTLDEFIKLDTAIARLNGVLVLMGTTAAELNARISQRDQSRSELEQPQHTQRIIDLYMKRYRQARRTVPDLRVVRLEPPHLAPWQLDAYASRIADNLIRYARSH